MPIMLHDRVFVP